MPAGQWTWDATTTLEALGAADVALWVWEPDADRLRLTGATRVLGLGPARPRLLLRRAAGAGLAAGPGHGRGPAARRRAPEPKSPCACGCAAAGSASGRGVWLEEGRRAAGVVAPETKFAAAEQDTLTGLLDRRSFIVRARERLQAPGEHELIVADLDRLRRLNEALGHERADLVLAALGSRLAAAFPPGSLLARIGEDEFAVLARKDASPGSQALRRALEQPLRVAGFDIHPTLSIGAVTAEGGEAAPEAAELLRRAELAVEAAKSHGRGNAAAYGRGLETDGLSRLALEGDLKGALARGELTAFYQPIVRLSTGELSGFEALVRWRHPRRGLLMPEQFLSLLDEMGMMRELGAHVMREAARQLAAWRLKHRAAGELTVAVNLSTGELDRPNLVAEVAALREETGLPPGALKLEVTESDVMRNPEKAAVVLGELRQAGAALALDDFGTGFSSLSYLTRLPFDTLKIDRYFVRTMATNDGSAKIVSSVVRLGRDLSLEVVAEGVENAGMARRLLELGCDYGQGFGYAPALSPQEAEVYLNESYVDGAAPLIARGTRG